MCCGDQPLCEVYPSLFAISDNPNAKLADMWIKGRWEPCFRRSLGAIEGVEWDGLRVKLQGLHITQGRDEVSWKLGASGVFSMGSLYEELFKSATPCDLAGIWQAQMPAEIMIFLWQVARNRITSGNQVQKRHGPGDGKCIWCGESDDGDNLLFQVARFNWSALREARGCSWNPSGFWDLHCLIQGTTEQDRRMAWLGFGALAWALWTTRYKDLIEGKFFRHPSDLL